MIGKTYRWEDIYLKLIYYAKTCLAIYIKGGHNESNNMHANMLNVKNSSGVEIINY